MMGFRKGEMMEWELTPEGSLLLHRVENPKREGSK